MSINADTFNKFLSPEFDSSITSFVSSSDNVFQCELRASCKDDHDLKSWISFFEEASATNWVVAKTYPNMTNFVCRRDYACHHSKCNKMSQPDAGSMCSRNTNCIATCKMWVKKRTENTIRKDRDIYMSKGLDCIIKFNWNHNHTIHTAHFLSFLRALPDTRDKFMGYFAQCMSPADAIRFHADQLELMDKYDVTMCANASVNPKASTVYYWYGEYRRTNYGAVNGETMMNKLKEKIVSLNGEGMKVAMSDSPLAIVIITPIMQRAHLLPLSGDICFVDSTSSCDSQGHTLTIMLVCTNIGAVPCGMLITDSQSRQSYQSAFELFRTALGAAAFGGQGEPRCFMTDSSDAERSALNAVFPNSATFLCSFHVNQAVWRWLWDTKNDIRKEQRPELMRRFRNVLYAQTDELATLFHCGASSSCRRYSKSAIRVQPTSTARRTNSSFGGNRKLPAGRPAGVRKGNVRKRQRNFAINVKLNQPNPKKH